MENHTILRFKQNQKLGCFLLLLFLIYSDIFISDSLLNMIILFLSSSTIASVRRSVVSDSATPWTVALEAPLSMEFSRQE